MDRHAPFSPRENFAVVELSRRRLRASNRGIGSIMFW
jgi:hypothetical protein